MIFGHVGVSVSNLTRSVAFYKKHFGLRCIKKYLNKGSGLVIALLKKGDIVLELFEFKDHKPLPQYRKKLDSDLRTLGVKHFSVGVKDIKGVYRKFKLAGVIFAGPMKVFDNGCRYFFIKDPDGILVEVMEA
jgi:glyoxylase I family protein